MKKSYLPKKYKYGITNKKVLKNETTIQFLKMISLICVIFAVSTTIAYGQTTATYCPSGYYSGYTSTAQQQHTAPIMTLSGRTYYTCATQQKAGYYNATSAEQCCYNFATQTGGTCTTWTYDSCGRCYLSTARLIKTLILYTQSICKSI